MTLVANGAMPDDDDGVLTEVPQGTVLPPTVFMIMMSVSDSFIKEV